MHGKLPFCFNNRLNSSIDWHCFYFPGKLFYKALPLKIKKSISYCWVFSSVTRRRTPLLVEYRIFSSVSAFHMKLGLSFRSSRPELFCQKGALKIFAKFTGKHLCQSLYSNKVAGLDLQLYQKRDSGAGFPVNLQSF